MRWLNLIVVAALVSAAAYVYKIKFDATRQSELVAKVRQEIRREQDGVARLRAEWARLDTPSRVQRLAQRHLALKPIEAAQIDAFDRLPERPPNSAPLSPPDDPIAAKIEDDLADELTGSLSAPPVGR